MEHNDAIVKALTSYVGNASASSMQKHQKALMECAVARIQINHAAHDVSNVRGKINARVPDTKLLMQRIGAASTSHTAMLKTPIPPRADDGVIGVSLSTTALGKVISALHRLRIKGTLPLAEAKSGHVASTLSSKWSVIRDELMTIVQTMSNEARNSKNFIHRKNVGKGGSQKVLTAKMVNPSTLDDNLRALVWNMLWSTVHIVVRKLHLIGEVISGSVDGSKVSTRLGSIRSVITSHMKAVPEFGAILASDALPRKLLELLHAQVNANKRGVTGGATGDHGLVVKGGKLDLEKLKRDLHGVADKMGITAAASKVAGAAEAGVSDAMDKAATAASDGIGAVASSAGDLAASQIDKASKSAAKGLKQESKNPMAGGAGDGTASADRVSGEELLEASKTTDPAHIAGTGLEHPDKLGGGHRLSAGEIESINDIVDGLIAGGSDAEVIEIYTRLTGGIGVPGISALADGAGKMASQAGSYVASKFGYGAGVASATASMTEAAAVAGNAAAAVAAANAGSGGLMATMKGHMAGFTSRLGSFASAASSAAQVAFSGVGSYLTSALNWVTSMFSSMVGVLSGHLAAIGITSVVAQIGVVFLLVVVAGVLIFRVIRFINGKKALNSSRFTGTWPGGDTVSVAPGVKFPGVMPGTESNGEEVTSDRFPGPMPL